jgi:maleate isomerase
MATDPKFKYGTRGRVGLLLPSGNQAAEPQLAAMLPDGVALHTTRLKLTGSSERELLGMVERVEEAAELAADVEPALIVFHCTAVSTFSSTLEASILDRIRTATGRPVTATSEAIVTALRALRARRIVMLSPYIDEINRRETVYFTERGFEVLGCAGLDRATPQEMMAVTPAEWIAMGVHHRDDRADAYLISCTAVRATDVIDELEARLDRPVVTSNSAVAWHATRRLGIAEPVKAVGRLSTLSPASP